MQRTHLDFDYYSRDVQTASKKVNTQKWLNENPPKVSEWIEIPNEIHTMEKLTFSLKQALALSLNK